MKKSTCLITAMIAVYMDDIYFHDINIFYTENDKEKYISFN